MSSHLYTPAYNTRFGNLTAKSVLVRLCDQASDDAGVLWTSVATIARDTEISRRTVLRMIEVFVTMGLVELKAVVVTDRHGSRKRREIHVDLGMLGTDLTQEFAAAYTEAQGKRLRADSLRLGDDEEEGLFSEAHAPGVAETRAPSVAATRANVAETQKSVAETQKSVAETQPPHPHKGGTIIEPQANQSQRDAGGAELTPEQQAHLDKLAAETPGGGAITVKSWRAYYLEENSKAATAAAARRAEELKDDELRRQYGEDVDTAMAAMRKRCGFTWVKRGDTLGPVLRQAMQDQREMGKPVWRTAAQMESAWLLQRKQGERLRARYGPLAFYRDGHWLDPAGWHWNTALLAREAGAGVGSAR